MKLRTKFVLVLLAVSLVLSTATYGGLELYKEDLLDRSREDVDESARLAADQVSVAVANQVDYVGYVASRPESANFSRSGETLAEMTSRSRFVAAELAAVNGTVVDFDGPVTEAQRREIVGSDVSDTPHFRAGRLTATLAATEYDRSRDEHLVVVSAPVFGRNGDLVGVLSASMYVTSRTLLGSVVPLDTASQNVYVTSDDGTVYGSEGSFDQRIVGSATVEGTGWTVRVVRDRSELNDRLETLALAQGGGLFSVFLIVVGLWVWQYRATLRQTDELLSGFAALRRGDQDRRLSLAAGEEWAQISEGFNAMAAGLAEREAALREREQRLSVLNRFLRHNLRNDMNVVLGYAEHVRAVSDEDEVADMADRIVSKGGRMVETGEKARLIETAIDEADRCVVDLHEAVEDALATLREDHPEATLISAVPEGCRAVALSSVGTAVRLVAENGVVHTDGAATVSLRATTDGDRIRLRVTDDGPGISEYELETLRQTEETALQHGSGLGLWITRWIADRSGGDLSFPETEREGTTVDLTFEPAPPGAETGAVVEDDSGTPTLGGGDDADEGTETETETDGETNGDEDAASGT